MLFAVGTGVTSGYAAEPIAILRRSGVVDLPVDRDGPIYPASAERREAWVASVNAFAHRAFRKGSTLIALDAGVQQAVLRIARDDIREWEPGCGLWAVPVQLKSGTLAAGGRTLAVTSSARRVHLPLTRRPANEQESTILRRAAEAEFAKHQLPAEFNTLIEASGVLVFASRRSSAPALLVGHFSIFVPKERSGHGIYGLFLILERRQDGWEAAHADYDPPTRSTEGYYREDAIDLIDIDGDGRPELVTYLWAHEAFDFAIYRKQRGSWHRIFLGGGGGC